MASKVNIVKVVDHEIWIIGGNVNRDCSKVSGVTFRLDGRNGPVLGHGANILNVSGNFVLSKNDKNNLERSLRHGSIVGAAVIIQTLVASISQMSYEDFESK